MYICVYDHAANYYLYYILYLSVSPSHTHTHHVFSGLDNAGKSTLLNKFNGDSIYDIAPTLGFNIKTLEYNHYTLNIWDVGGQQTIRSYWRNYYECTDGLIFVIDSADKRRMEIVAKELQQLLKQEVNTSY